MKTAFSISLFIISIFSLHYSHSQNQYSFRVLANKGQNSLKNVAVGYDWKPVKAGAKLYKGDEVMVVSNGYIGLVHSSGKTIELKKPGTVSINDIMLKFNTPSTSLASKYADFVFSQITKEEKNPKGGNKISGAVERSVTPIHIMAPVNTFIFNPMAIIKWEAPKGTVEFIVTVKNLFDNTLITELTKESGFTIDLNDPKLKNENLLIVGVKSKDDSRVFSNEIGIKRLPEEEIKAINKDFNSLQAETSDETPLNKIIHATFYEQHNLLLDAITNYENAITLAPGVEDFRLAYDLFLTRNNLKN